ncbi:MAG: hypothetical protein OEU50_15575 [Gammaproteobacteria bacterium]|nr:hypothetical protein [Gammaproteobacteria bacterium]
MKINFYPLLTILINYFPAIYLIASAVIVVPADYAIEIKLLFILAWIYFLPPLICRLLILIWGRPLGTVSSASPTFIYWWFLTQLQIVFIRFPFLEEVLRIIPGAYNLWLNLWGGKVSLFAYWSPGVTVADRYLISVGRGAVLGGGCRIGAHILVQQADNTQLLTLAEVRIDEYSVIGIHAGVGPGCHVHAHETLPGGKLMRPFYSWKDGRIHRPEPEI